MFPIRVLCFRYPEARTGIAACNINQIPTEFRVAFCIFCSVEVAHHFVQLVKTKKRAQQRAFFKNRIPAEKKIVV